MNQICEDSKYCSFLSGERGDSIIVGASNVDYLKENLNAFSSDVVRPLPYSVVRAFDDAWSITRPVCASYFR